MQAGTVINSCSRECPEHCENCSNLESRYESGSIYDGVGFTVDEDMWYECKLDNDLCAEEFKDCPTVRDAIECLPKMCQSCEEVQFCQFQGLELKVDFDEIRECYIEEFIESGGYHVANETYQQIREFA